MTDASDKAINRLSKLPRPASGIPKPSALPRPASTTTSGLQAPRSIRPASVLATPSVNAPNDGETRTSRLRASASRDSLRSSISNNPTPRANPRLRASASRDSLTSNTNLARTPLKPRVQPLSSTPRASQIGATPQTRRRSSVQPQAESLTEVEEPQVSQELPVPADDQIFKRRTTLTRRPSEVMALSPSHELFEATYKSGASSNSPTDEMLPPLEPPASRSVRPRPSLTERTMQSLAQIPSSPAVSKKRSTFFDQGRSRSRAGSSSSRPGSSYNSDGSARPTSRTGSRPGSSSGQDDNGRPATATAMYKSSLSTIDGTPEGITTGLSSLRLPKASATPSRVSLSSSSRLASGLPSLATGQSPSPTRKTYGATQIKTGSKTVGARPLKPRASVNGLFKKPSVPAMGQQEEGTTGSTMEENGWDGTIAPPPLKIAKRPAVTNDPDATPTDKKSSSALRDQIAKAKAAKRAAMRQQESSHVETQEGVIIPTDDTFDFGVAHEDPFNLRKGENPGKKMLQQRVAAARTTGRLNIAALNLKEMPIEVLKMYDLSSIGGNDGSWAESVDLTRFIGADNEFETLDDFMFPDSAPNDMDVDDEGPSRIFGGLETLDLHNNLLINVPLGFRQLNFLTSLNLSNNRLSNNCLDTIAQMSNLRDLKMANNLFFGPLPQSFSNLAELELLDLHGNNISALPNNVENMTHLRILNLNENSFESLPFEGLAQLPLTELTARKNKLSGTLIQDPIGSLPHLQTLDVSTNQLQRLVELGCSIDLPLCHALSMSMNRLQGLPDMTAWTSLLTLTVDENAISGIPNSFTSLTKLRHADFSGNDIRVVPAEIARMDDLSMIRLSGNPLRDKKFVSISTEELKNALASRLEPPPPYQDAHRVDEAADEQILQSGAAASGDSKAEEDYDSFDDDFATPPTSAHNSPTRSRSHTNASLRSRARTLSNQIWPVKQGGLLDRSNTESSSLHPVVASKVAAEHQIKTIHLHHNLFSQLPNSLSFFADTLTTLSLAHNQLVGEAYLTEELELGSLRELNLSNNRITNLEPLITSLRAPRLEKLDVSMNRLSAIPDNLRQSFSALTVLLMANNHLIELTPESIKGMKIVDAQSNDISHLNPKIGLLGGEGGLQKLEVMGNRFRVPRFNVLERGTEATLRWLRGRVPIAEMGDWKGDDADEEAF